MTKYTLSPEALEAAAESAENWDPSVHGMCAANYYHRGHQPESFQWDQLIIHSEANLEHG